MDLHKNRYFRKTIKISRVFEEGGAFCLLHDGKIFYSVGRNSWAIDLNLKIAQKNTALLE
jgi:hypothetical protein